ncbi:hypothetical protein WJX72_007551 [[Myrmecia] bisecta]|uniref:Uncharacterized protein n=1 Tax=[Myrmecia] bisecta TaxID=41462 RepID=A0AAW1QFN4_9CHLO
MRSALPKLSLLKWAESQLQFKRTAFNTAKRTSSNPFDSGILFDHGSRRTTLNSPKAVLGQPKAQSRKQQEEVSTDTKATSSASSADSKKPAPAHDTHHPHNYYANKSQDVDRSDFQKMFY